MMNRSIEIGPSDYKVLPSNAAELSDWENVLKEEESIRTSLLGPALTGLAMLVFGVGGFAVWATFTNIAQASVAAAKVIVESNTKTVTHLEGGTLEALAVSEGQKVKKGDLLATLDSTRAKSTMMQLQQQAYVLDIRLARLAAERDEKKDFAYDAATPRGIDQKTALEWLQTERKLFNERRTQFETQIATDRSLIDELKSENAALVARRASWVEQASILKHDYDTQVALRKKQLTTKSRENEVRLQLVDMSTRIAESDAAIAANKQKSTQAELTLVNRRTDYFRLISEQIQTAQADRAKILQDIVAAEDVVGKSAIRSPQDGIIANIRIRTPGSAVIAGQPVLDIVPANQPMLLEGKARAMDIDTIHVGESVEIRLASFGAAEELPLMGKVVYVAPDSLTDERTGETVYLFRAKIDASELKKQPNLFLYPGMTASVNIVNGTRSALAFLTQPLMQSFSRAFHEK
jgi:HlyD family secretion protein